MSENATRQTQQKQKPARKPAPALAPPAPALGEFAPEVAAARAPALVEGLQGQPGSGRLRQAGVTFQKRRFRPHVTIARLPKTLSPFELEEVRDDLAGNAVFRGSRFDVTSFQLYQSVLTSKSALHEELASYDLVQV